MNDDSPEPEPDSDAAVEALIEEFGGDPRAAILALMHDIDVLARDYEASVSRGFVRQEKQSWLRTVNELKAVGGDEGRERSRASNGARGQTFPGSAGRSVSEDR